MHRLEATVFSVDARSILQVACTEEHLSKLELECPKLGSLGESDCSLDALDLLVGVIYVRSGHHLVGVDHVAGVLRFLEELVGVGEKVVGVLHLEVGAGVEVVLVGLRLRELV